MSTTTDTTNSQKMVVIELPYIKRFYNINTGYYTECIMCDHGTPLSTEAYNITIIPIEDSIDTQEILKCAKVSPNDELNDQERFLKERDKKQFKRMKRGR